ncbi:(Fe-S)-binding protein [Luteolibacter sp. LG18]|uniref:(Fe-S)-binding protein n=1 Tax=Luteolibacter sp. LG18 TaxID=2819286 RepID=UPI0031F3F61C
MCLPTCPTYDATRRERNSPRGRISLMRSIADGELEMGEEFAAEMSYCLGCLACQSACPAGVDYARLFETARADIEQQGIRDTPSRIFWRTLVLRVLFMRPRLLRWMGRALHLYQKTGLDRLVRRLGLTRLLPADLRRLEPQTPRIESKFSSDLIAAAEEPATHARCRVALLTGCIQDLAFSSINRDTADVLLANGCSVHTQEWQPCCGSLHAHNGELGMAASLARRMIDLIPPGDYDAIITNAGGCGSHLRHYSTLLAGDHRYADRAKEWDRKVKDIHEWLVDIHPRIPTASPFETETSVTYHDSCHLAHGQKVVSQPRAILKLIPGLRYIELPEASWCCGSAGVYSITQPEQSARLQERKIGHIAGTGALIVATSNPGCHLHIVSGLRAAGINVAVEQPVTLLARAYRREKKPSGSIESTYPS